MAVFERPARHGSHSGEAGGRYLKKIPPDLAVVKYVQAVAQKEIPLSGH
jgi:hypothetical protein